MQDTQSELIDPREYLDEQIDLREYLSVLIKRRWTIIAISTVVILTAAVHTLTSTPIFRATARIVIEKENPNLVSIQEVMAMDAGGTDYYQTQYKIIESRTVAREVIRRLDLANSLEFFPKPKEDIISNVKRRLGDTIGSWKDWIKSLLVTDAPIAETEAENDGSSIDSGLVSAFIGRIHVSPIRNSRLVDVSLEAMDPVLSARMANGLVVAYIDQNLETKLLAAKDAVKWLSDRIEEERKKVANAENALLRYKEENRIITDFSSDTEQITAQKLASLNEQVVAAESRRVEAETRYEQALAVGDSPDLLDSIPEVLSNDLVKEIKKMEINLYNRMSELSKKYGRNHPKMIAIESELAELKKRKAVQASKVVRSLRNEYKLAVAREESLKSALAQQKAESLELNKKAVQYGVLKRNAESAKNIYDLLIKRFRETSLTEEMRTGNIRIIDRAEIPKAPVKPKKRQNILLAAILGLALGVGMAFLLEYLDNTIKLPEEIRRHLDIPFLGLVPAIDFDPARAGLNGELISIHSPRSTASESFRGIRTGILFSSADDPPRVLLITSAVPAEGKTICAANLAVIMAQAGSRVLLLDCDMRRPRIHRLFGISRDAGMSSALIGESRLREAIVSTEINNLDILPVGQIPPNPSELLGSKKMMQIIADTLKEGYERIIIDSPPVVAVTDAVVLSSISDGTLLIVRAGETPRQMMQNAVQQLKSVNANILGAVLNGIRAGRDNYYYKYYYYDYEEGEEQAAKGRRRKRRAKA